MEILENTIQTTLESFDFAYCITVNIATYIVIQIVTALRKKVPTTWGKRLILLFIILSTGVLYWLIQADLRLLINSAILAPVFWSWVMKPICKLLNIDYKQILD